MAMTAPMKYPAMLQFPSEAFCQLSTDIPTPVNILTNIELVLNTMSRRNSMMPTLMVRRRNTSIMK